MSEFIFMLTNHDATVTDALAAYDAVRDTGLRCVGFKDIGVSVDVLATLCERIRGDGRTAFLEVVSVSADDELRSIRAALEIGVDVVMGGTQVDAALEFLGGSAGRYYPFPGRVSGHPSILEGTVDEIAASAGAITSRNGVHGLDLLAYRHVEPVEPIIDAVVRKSAGPVVVAGSVTNERQIRAITSLGAWGFTIGGAVFDHALPAEPAWRAQVVWALEAARVAAQEAAR